MTKTQNWFGTSNFGHCVLFGICNLLFGIFSHPDIRPEGNTMDPPLGVLKSQRLGFFTLWRRIGK